MQPPLPAGACAQDWMRAARCAPPHCHSWGHSCKREQRGRRGVRSGYGYQCGGWGRVQAGRQAGMYRRASGRSTCIARARMKSHLSSALTPSSPSIMLPQVNLPPLPPALRVVRVPMLWWTGPTHPQALSAPPLPAGHAVLKSVWACAPFLAAPDPFRFFGFLSPACGPLVGAWDTLLPPARPARTATAWVHSGGLDVNQSAQRLIARHGTSNNK